MVWRWVRIMLIIASLMGLAVASLAMDLSSPSDSAGGRAANDPGVDDPTLPPIMPDPGIGDVSSDDHDEGGLWAESQTIRGDEGSNQLMGGDGYDLIKGYGDSDDLRGGQGDDTIFAGGGDDWVQGDASYGPGGNDEIHGGTGHDSLAGQGGDDLIWGDEGDDTILGGEGNDTLFGGTGNDWLAGNDGDDVLVSGGGADDLDGGRGDDHLIGDDDAETVYLRGGEGSDTLMPGAGDFSEGQEGADLFVLRQAQGVVPIIADYNNDEDQIVLHLPASIAEHAVIDIYEDNDHTFLISVNGEPVGRLLQAGGLTATDIGIVRLGG